MSTDGDATAPAKPSRGQSRGRSAAVWIVLVIAGLLLLLSSFAVWINRVALNTRVFTSTSSSLLDNHEIRSAVANRAVDELFANVDVQAEVEAQLPDDYKGLSGAATAGLRQASYQIVDRALEQSVFQQLFKATLEESHQTLVEVLEGGGDRVSTQSGEVTLDLRQIIEEAADRIGIGSQVADKLPEDAGRIVILRADELDTAQNAFELLKTLAWVLPLLTLAAFGLAVWLAGDRRRAVRGIGITLAVVGLLGLVAAKLDAELRRRLARRPRGRSPGGQQRLEHPHRPHARLVPADGRRRSPLRRRRLARRPRPSRVHSPRAGSRPRLQNRVWAYVVLGVVVLLLLFNSEVADFTRLLLVAIIAALGATWIELTRRQTLREFPDAGDSTIVADTRARDDELVGGSARASTASESAAAPVADVSARLASLADLHSRGELTDEEYASAKARVLAGD